MFGKPPADCLFEPNGYCYSVIATNRGDLLPEQVVWLHHDRGQVENRIKELKIGFGMEPMTSGDLGANAMWFGAGVLAHNLVQAQKLLFLAPDWRPKTVATLRWQLWQTAGRTGGACPDPDRFMNAVSKPVKPS